MNIIAFDTVFSLVTLLLALATLPGTLYLLVLSIAGLRAPLRPSVETEVEVCSGHNSEKIAIVVPAHNESAGIGKTLANLCDIATRDGSACVVVVADNCNDDTAAVARSTGARVLERHNEFLRGKGYALDWAFCRLEHEGFLAYVVIDADTIAQANLLGSIRARFAAGAQAVQTRYTVLNAQQTPRTRLAALALLAFNCLRPRARHALGLSAGILGNGFALRRSLLEKVPYSATSVVEDLEYHLKLVENGVTVEFADGTEVRGEMPTANYAQGTQRARWEGGRLRMLFDHGTILGRRVLLGEGRFLDPLLDLFLLPLGYHSLLLICLALMPGFWAGALGIFGLLVLTGHVGAAARVGGLSFAQLCGIALQVPGYLFWKLGMLRSTLGASRTKTRWIRTARDTSL